MIPIQWEYGVTLLTTPSCVEQTQILDRFGKDGWELVSAVLRPDGNTTAYLKRPVTPQKPKLKILKVKEPQ